MKFTTTESQKVQPDRIMISSFSKFKGTSIAHDNTNFVPGRLHNHTDIEDEKNAEMSQACSIINADSIKNKAETEHSLIE